MGKEALMNTCIFHPCVGLSVNKVIYSFLLYDIQLIFTSRIECTNQKRMSIHHSNQMQESTYPKTPSRCGNVNQEVMFEQNNKLPISLNNTRRESRRHTLRLDTHGDGPAEPIPNCTSSSLGTTNASPVSSTTCTHSRQDSTTSYTPLRSARGSLSLGVRPRCRAQRLIFVLLTCQKGTAHHSLLSQRSCASQSGINRETWALPLANTESLSMVPDAVVTRSPLCIETNAAENAPDVTAAAPSRQEQIKSQQGVCCPRRSARHGELRNTAILIGTLCVLLVTSTSLCKSLMLLALIEK
jgi:hypothetical protein